MGQNTVPAAVTETPPQPPTAFVGCPFWAEVKTLWKQLIIVEHKKAVIILLRLLASKTA